MRNLINRLARVPLQVVGGAILLGAILLAVHYTLIAHIAATGGLEPEQWIGGLTVKWYWVLVPLSFIALWARRRDREGLLGRVGAVLLTSAPLMWAMITTSAIVWGGLLGRGDLPEGVMSLELLIYVFYLGALVTGLAFLLDTGARWWGAALIAGPVVDVVWPYGAAVTFAVFGTGLMLYGFRHRVPLDTPEISQAR
ncbi:hypothetical protein GCM10022226_37760 [Sphaerisporangium flaviroseum]|uniref:Uncharacterized protein n=1 Tax=Sphaerisporangium flaviroseum TaxID=509199 RepID=A0ABP7IAH4_9ACTN